MSHHLSDSNSGQYTGHRPGQPDSEGSRRAGPVLYEKEFLAFMDREMDQLERLDAWYNNFVTDYLRYLTYDRAFDATKSIQLLGVPRYV